MKVLINRDPRVGPWGGGAHFVNAFHKHAKENGIEIVKSLESSPDVIFIFHPDSEEDGISFLDARKHKIWRPKTKIVVRVNECDARKMTSSVDLKWLDMSKHADHAFFVSEWMKDYFVHPEKKLSGLSFHPFQNSIPPHKWSCYSNEILINGVDRTKFEKREKLSKTNSKTNIVCAHWSSNKLKGQDIYEYIDDFVSKNDEFSFTYIGRTNAKLSNSVVIPPMDPIELVKKLSEYDVCVNGTFWDPGPNAVIESIVAGLPTYVHSQSGGAADFAGLDHVFTNVAELEKILLSKQFLSNRDIFPDWGAVMKSVFERIKSL